MSVTEVLAVFAGACGVLAGVGCAYLIAGGLLVLRFGRAHAAAGEPGEAVPVTVLVPLCGDEPGLTERLIGLREQDYPAPVQIVCGARDAGDGALAHVSAAASQPARWPLDASASTPPARPQQQGLQPHQHDGSWRATTCWC